MKLGEIHYGIGFEYRHKPSGRSCQVVSNCRDDGACLIIEFFTEGDVSNELAYSEADELDFIGAKHWNPPVTL